MPRPSCLDITIALGNALSVYEGHYYIWTDLFNRGRIALFSREITGTVAFIRDA